MLIEKNNVYNVDALTGLKGLPDDCLDCCLYSPPYFSLRSYLNATDPNKVHELGQEPKFSDYLDKLIEINKEIYRALKKTGTLFVNLGDTYFSTSKGTGGLNKKQVSNKGAYFEPIKLEKGQVKTKSLCNIPWRFAIRMTDELGFIHRNSIIWHKGNAMPTSASDRFSVDYEPILFFTKSQDYYFEQQLEPFSQHSNPNEIYTGQATKDYDEQGAQNPSDAKRRILESMRKRGGRNKRCVWKCNVKPSKYAHTATFSEELITPLVKAGCPENGMILDCFGGTGTVGVVAQKLNQNFLIFELSEEFSKMARERLKL